MPLYFCYFHSNNRTASRASHFGLHENYMHVLAMCPEAGDGRRSNTSFVILFFSFCGLISMTNWLIITISWPLNYLDAEFLCSTLNFNGKMFQSCQVMFCWCVWKEPRSFIPSCLLESLVLREKGFVKKKKSAAASCNRKKKATAFAMDGPLPSSQVLADDWHSYSGRKLEGEKLPRVFWLHCYYFPVLHA